MPSEVGQKENDISIVEKEIKRLDTKDEVKENVSKTEGEVQVDNTSDESNIENKEPSVEDTESQKKLAGELLVEGKRHLIIKDFQAAADVLSEACSLFGTVYGEMGEECAEAYFMYGCALLELSKDQINPVGLEENNDDENDSIQDESIADTDQNDTNEEKEATIPNEEEKSSENEKIPKDHEVEEENEEENPDEENIEVDDVNDLQLAWEMLELAKVIYKNKDTEESKLKLAEVLMKCGEVSIEDEKFETAIEDMTESLQIRR